MGFAAFAFEVVKFARPSAAPVGAVGVFDPGLVKADGPNPACGGDTGFTAAPLDGRDAGVGRDVFGALESVFVSAKGDGQARFELRTGTGQVGQKFGVGMFLEEGFDLLIVLVDGTMELI